MHPASAAPRSAPGVGRGAGGREHGLYEFRSLGEWHERRREQRAALSEAQRGHSARALAAPSSAERQPRAPPLSPYSVLTAPQEVTCWTREGGDVLRFGDRAGERRLLELALPRPLRAQQGGVPRPLRRFGRQRSVDEVLAALSWAGVPRADVRVVSHRKPLASLLTTAALPNQPYEFDACFVDGTLYLNEVTGSGWQLPSPEQALLNPVAERHLLAAADVQAFEAALTVPSGDPCDALAQAEFVSLVGLHIGPLSVACATEVDAVNAATGEYLELKTFVQPPPLREGVDNPEVWRLLRYSHPKWWAQCVVSGVREVVAGARDEHGVLRAVHRVKVGDLAALTQRGLEQAAAVGALRGSRASVGARSWDPSACTRYAAEALGFLHAACAAHPEQSARVRYAPRTDSPRSLAVTCVIGEGDSRLPRLIKKSLLS